MSKIVSKENIIKAFDKASGFGVEFGDFADYHEIQPIRDEFVMIIDQLFKIEMRQITSIISDKSLAMITEDLKKHYPQCSVCGCERESGGSGLCKNSDCQLSELEQMV